MNGPRSSQSRAGESPSSQPSAAPWTSPSRWLSAIQQLSTSVPHYQPRSGAMLTSRLRLVRPVNDGRGDDIWVADQLALAIPVEVTFAATTNADADADRAEMIARAQAFHDRAEAAARIDDPHVVRFLEQGQANGVPFVVTKLLEGKSMRRRLLHGPASLAEVQRVVRGVTGALTRAHAQGIAHGNLCPDHLFTTELGGEEFLDITGFGDVEANPAESPYASPERLLHGTASDVRSDLWALAVTVYELLTTTLPFEAPTPAGVTVAICNAAFARPSLYRADLPPGVDGWFEAALAKDPARRFRDAAEFASAFELALASDGERSSVSPDAQASVAPPLAESPFDPDDEDDDEEMTVKWDMPEDARAIARGSLPFGSLPSDSIPPGSLPPGVGSPSRPALLPMTSHELALISKPGPVSFPPRPSVPLPATLPPALEPGVYLDSPYMASVMSALSVPASPAAVESTSAPARRRLLGIEGPLFTPDKTWLAALAFAAGVAVTWFAYEPEPEGEPVAAEHDANIRTLSVDDLPRVEGEDVENLRIIPTRQLPRASDDVEGDAPVRSAASGAGSGSSSGAGERRAAPAQQVRALTPAPARPATPKPAAASPARSAKAEVVSNCNPPYYFDSQGIRRLKSECLNGTGVIQGPYGAVITTNVSTKATGAAAGGSSNKAGTDKQARAGAGCTPPYYFDGKIRRLKLECL